MTARNPKQARSQLEPLTTAEMFAMHGLIERAKANGQWDDLTMSSAITGGRLWPETEGSPESSVADFMLVENANEQPTTPSSAAVPPKKGLIPYKAPPTLPKTAITSAPPMVQPSSMSSTRAALVDMQKFILPSMHLGMLPKGVSSLQHWSRTLCELPKVKEHQWSYGRVCQEAWNNRELLTYLKWVATKFGDDEPKTGKASDLAAFLKAVAYPFTERMQAIDAQRPVAPDDGQLS